MNETISTKYELAPEAVEKRSLNPNDGKYFKEIYDFMTLKKIGNNQTRNERYTEKIDKRKRKLRSPLNLDLEKKMHQAIFIRLQLIIYPFSTEIEFLLLIKERAKLNNDIYLYWAEENDEKIDGRFFMEELFALKINF